MPDKIDVIIVFDDDDDDDDDDDVAETGNKRCYTERHVVDGVLTFHATMTLLRRVSHCS